MVFVWSGWRPFSLPQGTPLEVYFVAVYLRCIHWKATDQADSNAPGKCCR
jgi:hypothetical protein